MDTEIIYGIGLGFSVGWNVLQLVKIRGLKNYLADLKLKEPKSTPKPKPVEKYGHPYDIVSDIRSDLPELEWPYAWETWVDEGKECRFVFQITKLNDTDVPVLKHGHINLTSTNKGKLWEDVYADAVAGYGYHENIKKAKNDVYAKVRREARQATRELARVVMQEENKDRKVNYKLGK